MARTGNRTAKKSTLRIIGGRWRGRKLTFSPAKGLRPTADRVRETLFNWLAPAIRDARCLDLFAGSGALGLEALSRGAAGCDFVDTSATALRDINLHLQTLGASSLARSHPRPAMTFLQTSRGGWDIVFIDPPFGQGLVEPVCAQLASPGLLTGRSLVYVESAAREPTPTVPTTWQLHREKIAGEVAFRLFMQGAQPADSEC